MARWCQEVVELVEKADVDRWLRAYVEAWKSYDSKQIGELFSEDVRYRYHPHDEPVVGRSLPRTPSSRCSPTRPATWRRVAASWWR